MKHSRNWLLALLSVLTLMATTTLAVAEEDSAHFSGKVEIGATAVDIKDNPARVQEYSTYRSDDGVSAAPSLNLEYLSKDFLFMLDSDIKGTDNQKHALELDFKRIIRLDSEYQEFEHWLDHDTLEHMGATMKPNLDGGQPTVSTDKIFGEIYGDDVTAPGIGGVIVPDPATSYAQEMDNDYIIEYREWKNDASVTIPAFPNITVHAGMRIEEREGLKQAIGLSKCDGCHVSATGKEIDERTEDFTAGVTGTFGLLTVDYEYLNRSFTEDGATPVRFYDDATAGDAGNQLLYDNGYLPFNRTPDSDKDSHMVRARVDLPSHTNIIASYVKADIESNKDDVKDPAYRLEEGTTLKTEYESYGAKAATMFGKNLRVAARASTYQIDAEDNRIYFPERANSAYYPDNLPFDTTDEWVTAEERDVTEFGLDAVYRLARATTLRLGYGYEKVDRDEEELGETETNTFKASVKTRLNRSLSGRLSYEYQNIDDPFHGEDVTGIAQGIGITDPAYPGLEWLNTGDFLGIDNNSATKVWYWNSVYPNRTLDATNQPEDVHEAKFATTWSPSARMAATLSARVRMEENDAVDYEQKTYVPGVSAWYAPSGNLSLTMAYTFNKQETENKMCVGWYHG